MMWLGAVWCTSIPQKKFVSTELPATMHTGPINLNDRPFITTTTPPLQYSQKGKKKKVKFILSSINRFSKEVTWTGWCSVKEEIDGDESNSADETLPKHVTRGNSVATKQMMNALLKNNNVSMNPEEEVIPSTPTPQLPKRPLNNTNKNSKKKKQHNKKSAKQVVNNAAIKDEYDNVHIDLTQDEDNNEEGDNEGITFNTKKRKRTQLKPLYDSPGLNDDSEHANEKNLNLIQHPTNTMSTHNNRNINRQTVVLVPCTPEEQYRQQQQQYLPVKQEKQPQQPKFQLPMKTNGTETSLTPNTKRQMQNQFRALNRRMFPGVQE